MELASLILSVVNTIILIGVSYRYFIDHYTVVTLEDWNKVANFYNAHFDEYDDNGEPIPEEKVGGCGFFQDQIEEIDEDEQEE